MHIRIGRILVLASLMLWATIPAVHAVTTYDLANGPVTIAADGDYILTGYGAGNNVIVKSGVDADIVFSNLSVVADGACPFLIEGGANVACTLVGATYLTATESWGTGFAALQVSQGAVLIVSSNSTGMLEATVYGYQLGSAGIGSSWGDLGGDIFIMGGEVTATGGAGYAGGGAGIGSGAYGAGGNVSISGGIVTATGGSSCPGIGAGSEGTIGTISISDGARIWAGPSAPGTQVDSYAGEGFVCVAFGALPVRVKVDDQDISVGVGPGWTYDGSVLSVVSNRDYVISGTNSQNQVQIKVNGGVVANIVLQDLYIKSDAPVSIAPGAIAHLTVLGDNQLVSLQLAGIHVPGGATLVISSNSTGSLYVDGGSPGSAGIGGSEYNKNAGVITIEGGTITTLGGGHDWDYYGHYYGGGAGIGGAYCQDFGAGGSGGTVTISGGEVTAIGEGYGAGIGGGGGGCVIPPGPEDSGGFWGAGGDGGTITITGGKVTASGASYGAGIGGGGGRDWNGSSYGVGGAGGVINISGGIVTATSDYAGIGGGFCYSDYPGASGIITIGSSAIITAGTNESTAVVVVQYNGEKYVHVAIGPKLCEVSMVSGNLNFEVNLADYSSFVVEGADCQLQVGGGWNWQPISNYAVNPDGSISVPMDSGAGARKIIRLRMTK